MRSAIRVAAGRYPGYRGRMSSLSCSNIRVARTGYPVHASQIPDSHYLGIRFGGRTIGPYWTSRATLFGRKVCFRTILGRFAALQGDYISVWGWLVSSWVRFGFVRDCNRYPNRSHNQSHNEAPFSPSSHSEFRFSASRVKGRTAFARHLVIWYNISVL